MLKLCPAGGGTWSSAGDTGLQSKSWGTSTASGSAKRCLSDVTNDFKGMEALGPNS